jgi:hypothetical protein
VGFAWRAIIVLIVFVGVGVAVDRAIATHERASRTPESQVRLAAAMAGLFAGGAGATIVVLALAFKRSRKT